MSFKSIDPFLLYTRNDRLDLSLGDHTKRVDDAADVETLKNLMSEASATNLSPVVLAGYPDHDGIQVNGGRVGAAEAPQAVRRSLYRLTPSLLLEEFRAQILDLGDLRIQGHSIERRHEIAKHYAKSTFASGVHWVAIGGGHDYAYADASAFADWAQTEGGVRPLVINFDAHLDVRSTDRGLSSGTSFYRLLNDYPDLDFAEIGIQAHCNSKYHFDWVRSRGARVLLQEEAEASGESFSTEVFRILGDWAHRRRPLFISIDIDGFSSEAAPGCSQSWPTGFSPHSFFSCFDILLKRFDVRGIGIYEVSPPLDLEGRTAKLAALIIHRFLMSVK